jgi:hypothetical protein
MATRNGVDTIRRRTRDLIACLGLADRLAVREVTVGSKHFRVVVENTATGSFKLFTISKSIHESIGQHKTRRNLRRLAEDNKIKSNIDTEDRTS